MLIQQATRESWTRTSQRVVRLIDFSLWYAQRERLGKRREAGTENEDWKVEEEINWSHYVTVCYLGWRSSRESKLGLQMKPGSELCETAPTYSRAKQTRQSYQITHSQPFGEDAERLRLHHCCSDMYEHNTILLSGLLTRKLIRCIYL